MAGKQASKQTKKMVQKGNELPNLVPKEIGAGVNLVGKHRSKDKSIESSESKTSRK